MELDVGEILKASLHLQFAASSSMLQKLNEMRKENKFCDVTLKINNKDLFSVHKTVIASSCEYFGGLFKGDWKETREDVISLDYEISPECFEVLLEYLYTATLALSVISYENALTLHKAALFFNLLKLKTIMSKILQKFITSATMLNLWRHGVNYFDDPLRDKCIELISESPIDFCKKNLCELTFEELKKLCENKNLNCTQEEIYKKFMEWTKADFECREKYLKDLLHLVDFSKISGKFIKQKILTDEILFKNEEFVKKIMRELSKSFEVTAKNTIDTTTVNEDKKLNILLISNTGIFKIDLENRICHRLLSYNICKDFAVNKFGSNILLSGCSKSNTICKYYYPELNLIREFPAMLEGRRRHKALSYGDKIYVFGGVNSDSMEIFDMSVGKWNFGPKMPRRRWNFALQEFGGCIYIMGGFDNICPKTIPTDIFDVVKMNWTSCLGLKPETLTYVQHIDSTGCLLKSDGYYKYDFQNKILEKKWFKFQENMSYYDAIKFNNKIFIVGIKKSKEFFSGQIDIKTDTLTEIKIDFTQCDDIGSYFRLTSGYL